MIPKIIHYCWFGRGEMPKLMKKCIKSWKKFCPGWKVVLWNEDTFDVNSNIWTKQAYEARKFAFVTDYVRLKALYEQGGVYMDADVELVQPIDRFLEHEAFSGFENPQSVPTGIIAAQAGHPVIKGWLDWYVDRPYLIDGKPNMEPNVSFMTRDLLNRGLVLNDTYQVIGGFAMYPQTYFCPLHTDTVHHCRTEKTVAIHHFTSTWRTPKGIKDMKKAKFHTTWLYQTWEQIKVLPQKTFRKIFGDNAMEKLKRIFGK